MMSDSFLHELIKDKIIICPFCQNDQIALIHKQISCSSCRKNWPVKNNVPDLFNNYRTDTLKKTNSKIIQENNEYLTDLIITKLELSRDKNYDSVKEIVNRATSLSCCDNALSAEIQDLKDRFLPLENKFLNQNKSLNANKNPLILLERHYLPLKIPANKTMTNNFRVKNIGQYPWSSKTEEPLFLSLHWARENGKFLGLQSASVRFPVDIEPGRSITIPVRIQTPPISGTYQLHICLSDKNRQIKIQNDSPIECTISNEMMRNRFLKLFKKQTTVKPIFGKKIGDYGKDHEKGREIFTTELKKMGKITRVLEIGSGTHPQTAWIPDSKVLALDISSPLLELGSLFFTEKGLESKLAFICADAFSPPLKKNSFDAIAIFSALHHFSEPEILLKRLSTLLTKNGFIAVMCEPVSDTLEAPETVRELLKGINEQVFSWQEYVQIFNMADLSIKSLQIDGGSLKAILGLDHRSGHSVFTGH